MSLIYGSVCSGIEAATLAWHPLGWRAAFFSEIDRFPCAVLAHHYPDIPNIGDMTQYQEWPSYAIDVLVGGTPCQSFSVAGLRRGLADPRGNLALIYLGLVDKLRPRWVVWENVPGVLSSNRGRDFGSFLGGLAELGYGWAYRVLDAQYIRVDGYARAVPQRRRRVFVVGHLGDWRRAAAVLFERQSLSGNPPPRREAGKGVAPTIAARTRGGGGLGTDFDCDGGPIPAVANPLTARMGKGINTTCDEGQTMVAHTLRGEGFDAMEDGTGRGTPLVPVAYQCQGSNVGQMGTLRAGNGNITGGVPFVTIAFDCKASGRNGFAVGQVSPTLRAMGHADRHSNGGGQVAVAVSLRGRDGGATAELGDEMGNCLRASSGGGDKPHVLAPVACMEVASTMKACASSGGWSNSADHAAAGYMQVTPDMQVRRLTPRECERLQGFPDDYTLVPHRGKPAADGPRYKALGNSMAVNVMRWIGMRIQIVDALRAVA